MLPAWCGSKNNKGHKWWVLWIVSVLKCDGCNLWEVHFLLKALNWHEFHSDFQFTDQQKPFRDSSIDSWLPNQMISLIFMFGFLCRYPDDLRNIVQQCANDQMTIYNLTQVACLGEVWSRSVRGASHVLWRWNHQGLYARLQICWCSVILGKSRNCGVKIVYLVMCSY